jgi:hypothetical protein
VCFRCVVWEFLVASVLNFVYAFLQLFVKNINISWNTLSLTLTALGLFCVHFIKCNVWGNHIVCNLKTSTILSRTSRPRYLIVNCAIMSVFNIQRFKLFQIPHVTHHVTSSTTFIAEYGKHKGTVSWRALYMLSYTQREIIFFFSFIFFF